MKLATIATGDGNPRPAVEVPGGLLDLAAALDIPSIKELLTRGAQALDEVSRLVAEVGDSKPGQHPAILAADAVRFLPPVPDPGKFLCVGKNYHGHLEELVRANLIKEIPKEPTAFIQLNSTMVGQDAEVKRPDGIVQFDYEPELAFVIGKPAYKVAAADAMEYVAGVTLFNDLTAREIQKREVESGTRFWTAKNMPGFAPVGPFIVTLDEVGDVNYLWLNCSVNGERRSRFNTSGQIFNIPKIIEHFSRYMPLDPGDLFATGSAAGVAIGHENADELFLKPGDFCVVELESHMELRTRIV